MKESQSKLKSERGSANSGVILGLFSLGIVTFCCYYSYSATSAWLQTPEVQNTFANIRNTWEAFNPALCLVPVGTVVIPLVLFAHKIGDKLKIFSDNRIIMKKVNALGPEINQVSSVLKGLLEERDDLMSGLK